MDIRLSRSMTGGLEKKKRLMATIAEEEEASEGVTEVMQNYHSIE